jgi:uncharacterized protein with FMN-binding domain
MNVVSRTNTLTLLAAIAVVAPLAGCAADATDSPAPTTGADSSSGTTAMATYTDGTYTETGAYQSPNGAESIEVTLTVEGNTVTAVDVAGLGTNPTTKQFQGLFSGGISAEVVGKNMDDLTVDKVAGSSLTSGGFTDALEKIKADARA